jgi:hypothetical protein
VRFMVKKVRLGIKKRRTLATRGSSNRQRFA